MQKHGIMLVAALALSFGQSIPQEKQTSETSVFKKASSGPERARLSFLIGSFVTETRILPGPMVKDGAVGRGTSVISWGLDSMFAFIDERSINPLLGTYKGFGVLGYNPKEQQYVLSMYNNFGDSPQYRGRFSGDTLSLTSTVQMPGGTSVQKVQWYGEGTAVRMRVLNNTGEGFTLVIDQWAHPAPGIAK